MLLKSPQLPLTGGTAGGQGCKLALPVKFMELQCFSSSSVPTLASISHSGALQQEGFRVPCTVTPGPRTEPQAH